MDPAADIAGERDEVGQRIVFCVISQPAERLVGGCAVIEAGSFLDELLPAM